MDLIGEVGVIVGERLDRSGAGRSRRPREGFEDEFVRTPAVVEAERAARASASSRIFVVPLAAAPFARIGVTVAAHSRSRLGRRQHAGGQTCMAPFVGRMLKMGRFPTVRKLSAPRSESEPHATFRAELDLVLAGLTARS